MTTQEQLDNIRQQMASLKAEQHHCVLRLSDIADVQQVLGELPSRMEDEANRLSLAITCFDDQLWHLCSIEGVLLCQQWEDDNGSL